MRKFTKKQLKLAGKIVFAHMNCCSTHHAITHDHTDPKAGTFQFKTELRVRVFNSDHGNILDSNAFKSMFEELKQEGLTGEDTSAVWIGFYEGDLYVWWVAE